VHLPALVLIISLIAFEHVFGVIGLFLSFPALYVGIKIAHDFQRPADLAVPARQAVAAAPERPQVATAAEATLRKEPALVRFPDVS
jgi:hypothetical protein